MEPTYGELKTVFSKHPWECRNAVFEPQLIESEDAKPVDTKGWLRLLEKIRVYVDPGRSRMNCKHTNTFGTTSQRLEDSYVRSAA